MLEPYFTGGPYRFSMQFNRGTFAEFYQQSGPSESILKQRKHWLAIEPEKYLALLPEAEPLLSEAIALAQTANVIPRWQHDALRPIDLAKALGEQLEPDYLLLTRGNEAPRLAGGCVCFPSSWALDEKIGRSMDEIHDIVPGLNHAVGRRIQTFLDKLKPGISWTRNNWGLSRSPELNQHPSRTVPRLDARVQLEEVFFRVEEQSLAALPESNGVLFGIRVKVFPLAESRKGDTRQKFVEALETMPEELARYKGLAAARPRILELLRE